MGAERFVSGRRGQHQVMRRRLHRGDVAIGRQQLQLPSGRDMQDVHAGAGLARQRQEIARRHDRRFRVAPFGMARRVALAAQGFAGVEARLVLAVKRDAPPRLGKQRPQQRRIVDQQIAGGRSHEHLDRRRSVQPFEPGKFVDIVRRGARVEGEVAMHPAASPRHFVGQRFGSGRRRIGVRHFEYCGHAAQHRGAAAAFEILAVLTARLAEMHMAVDDARQDMQAPRVEILSRPRRAEFGRAA